jgi:disulfide bond formation protein DsbB
LRVREKTIYLAWIVTLVATLGSLYFSEIRGFIPCELCWYQRILMYPLSILLGMAAFRQDGAIRKYILSLSIIGGLISTFHYLQQKIPGFTTIKPCTNGIPCSAQYINWLGFITIPFLALTAFVLVTILMLLTRQVRAD